MIRHDAGHDHHPRIKPSAFWHLKPSTDMFVQDQRQSNDGVLGAGRAAAGGLRLVQDARASDDGEAPQVVGDEGRRRGLVEFLGESSLG